MMNHVRKVIADSPPGTKFGAFELQLAGEGVAQLPCVCCVLRVILRK
jgi:hypothetical protein